MNGETLSTRFAYHYDLTLSLALPGPEFSAEDRRTLENGINSYNERSIYMNNPKHISLLEMGKNHIKIRLSSTQMLTTPGRGLRALTAILVKTPSFEGRVTPGGQLFRVLHTERPDDRGGCPGGNRDIRRGAGEGAGGLSAGTERRVGRQQKEKGRGGGDEAAGHRRRHDLPAAETE